MKHRVETSASRIAEVGGRSDPWFWYTLASFGLWVYVDSDQRLLGFNSTRLLLEMTLLKHGVTPIFLYALCPLSIAVFVYGVYPLVFGQRVFCTRRRYPSSRSPCSNWSGTF